MSDRQDPNLHKHPEAPPPSEDCLFLNVFTPFVDLLAGGEDNGSNDSRSTSAGAGGWERSAVRTGGIGARVSARNPRLLPVLFWIHGGGLCIGAGSEAWGTGWDIIKERNVVLVNFNYRCMKRGLG